MPKPNRDKARRKSRRKSRTPKSVRLHPSWVNVKGDLRDPRSHHTDTHFMHFAQDDDMSLLALILDRYLDQGQRASYGYSTSEQGSGPCIMLVLADG